MLKRTLSMVAITCAVFASGCVSGKLKRPSSTHANAGKGLPNIHKNAHSSVAYIELDRDGKPLDEGQIREAMAVLKDAKEKAAQKGRKLLLFTYVHGWRNGPLTGDAAVFQNSVEHMAEIGVKKGGFDALGLYIAWPGAPMGELNQMLSADARTSTGIPLLSWLAKFPETFTFWTAHKTAYRVGEHGQVRSIVRDFSRSVHGYDNGKFILMGHSMGAAVIEQAVVKQMANGDAFQTKLDRPDMVFMLNSAAHGRLAEHAVEKWTERKMNGTAEAPPNPQVVSVVADADTATGWIQRTGLWFGRCGSLVKWVESNHPTKGDGKRSLEVTPRDCSGIHTHWAMKEGSAEPILIEKARDQWLVHRNLYPIENDYAVARKHSGPVMMTTLPKREDMMQRWTLASEPGTIQRKQFTPYWIVKAGPTTVSEHNDVWDSQMISILATCWREAGLLGKKRAIVTSKEATKN